MKQVAAHYGTDEMDRLKRSVSRHRLEHHIIVGSEWCGLLMDKNNYKSSHITDIPLPVTVANTFITRVPGYQVPSIGITVHSAIRTSKTTM